MDVGVFWELMTPNDKKRSIVAVVVGHSVGKF